VEGFNPERRGLFDGLRVPHSLNAVVIAAVGLLVYVIGVWLLELIADVPGDGMCRLLGGMLGNLSVRLGPVGAVLADAGGWVNEATPYGAITWIAFVGWTSVVWAFFAGAIHRIAAMKIAREEGLELKDALRFGLKKFGQNLFSVAFVWLVIGFFYLIADATVAGFIGRIPVVGPILLGLLFFLVLISSFLIVFAAVLGLLGFNLAAAAIATEDSDTFDGVSRAWNYILARPWQVLLTYGATFAYIGIVLFAGALFLKTIVKSLSFGPVGLGRAPIAVEVDEEVAADLALDPDSRLETVWVPGKADYLYKTVIHDDYRADDADEIGFRQGLAYALDQFYVHVGRYPTEAEGLEALIAPPETLPEGGAWLGPYLFMDEPPDNDYGHDLQYAFPAEVDRTRYALIDPGRKEDDPADDKVVADYAVGHGAKLDIEPVVPTGLDAGRALIGFWVNVARLLIGAYVVAYFLCAQTTVYFLLRRDVEGDDYTEITLEDEPDDEGDQPFEYGSYRPPAADGEGEAAKPATGGKPLPTADAASGDDAAAT